MTQHQQAPLPYIMGMQTGLIEYRFELDDTVVHTSYETDARQYNIDELRIGTSQDGYNTLFRGILRHALLQDAQSIQAMIASWQELGVLRTYLDNAEVVSLQDDLRSETFQPNETLLYCRLG